MSRVAKATLCLAIATSAGVVFYVHYKQRLDRDRLHEGVIRDIERQQRRKTENLYVLQQQIDLTKQLRRDQENQLEKDS